MENKTPSQNIQDVYLNTVRRDKAPVTVFLISGVKLIGKIKGFDKYSVILEANNQEQLIFKHAISTVVTQKTAHSYASSSSAVGQSVSTSGAPVVPAHPEAPEA